MGSVADRLMKLASAGLPVAPLTACASDEDVLAAAQASDKDLSLRYEGARLRSASE